MRHRKKTAKLGRTSEHRNLMLANLVCSLIKERRIQTTLAKARAARPVAEKMVTLGKKGRIHDRRLAAARLRQEDAVRILFNEIAPQHKERNGGYTRIIRMHQRRGDAAQLAILEWVDEAVESTATETAAPAPEAAETPAPAPAPEAKEEAPAESAEPEAAPEKAEEPKKEAEAAAPEEPAEEASEEKKKDEEDKK